MISPQEYLKLQKEIQHAKEQAQSANGAYLEVLRRMKKEFDVSGTKVARILLKKMIKTRDTKQVSFEETFKSFEKKWGEYLEELE